MTYSRPSPDKIAWTHVAVWRAGCGAYLNVYQGHNGTEYVYRVGPRSSAVYSWESKPSTCCPKCGEDDCHLSEYIAQGPGVKP